jgi:anti-sigma B factor antagonist
MPVLPTDAVSANVECRFRKEDGRESFSEKRCGKHGDAVTASEERKAAETCESRLALHLDQVGSTPRLKLRGELDMAEIERFEAALADLEQARPPEIVVDLTDLDFIDSSGLSALLDADARARHEQRRLLMTRPSESIMRMLRLTLLDRRFEWVSKSHA